MHVYLAGPEVFLPDGRSLIERKRQILREHGLAPVPRPADLDPGAELDPHAHGLDISRRNEEFMESADACIANITPFRGLSADPGTVYELGYMAARGCPVYAYTNDPLTFRDRMEAQVYDGQALERQGTVLRGPDGLMVEDHAMSDNLMIDGGVVRRGGRVVRPEIAPADRWHDLTTFETCVAALAEHVRARATTVH